MKQIKTIAICVLVSFNSFSQDSTKVTINVQVRDLEYIGSKIYNITEAEEIYDSIKIKFRISNPPTGNTNVSVTAYTMDWLAVFATLKGNAVAINSNCTSRVESSLRAVGQTYLTNKLDALDTKYQDVFQNKRQLGRSKLKRQL